VWGWEIRPSSSNWNSSFLTVAELTLGSYRRTIISEETGVAVRTYSSTTCLSMRRRLVVISTRLAPYRHGRRVAGPTVAG
jgi:hypothetical protein